MIERFYLKDYISFSEVDIEFENGLILFSGASGVGKSILLNAFLGVFALKEISAKRAEVSLDNNINLQKYGLDDEENNIFRFSKDKTARYFINGSQFSKKNIKEISSNFIDYLSPKSYKEFENSRILKVLDTIETRKANEHQELLRDFKESFSEFKKVEKKLNLIKEKEKKAQETKDFILYEINKIEEINPKIGEYEELMQIKKSLSKKEKILEAIEKANNIFEYEKYAIEALSLLDEDTSFLDESLNDLRAKFENSIEKFSELDENEIENILDRIEKISSLIQRYGSVEETLKYLENKKKELKQYENLEFEKEELEKKYIKLDKNSKELALKISEKRKEALKKLNYKINQYLKMLYLDNITLTLEKKDLDINGIDKILIKLWGVELSKISSGEFNRVRLAFLSSFNDELNINTNGILILDEVDANLSGKESMSIATVLKKLSKNYQIFAISHQPQLTSKADIHFLVYKDNKESKVRKLETFDERVKELARMISGEKIGEEAIKFAKSLIEE